MATDSMVVVDYSRFTRWHVMPEMESLLNDISVCIYRAARAAIAARGEFRVVLAGGAAVQAVCRELADTDADWSRWQVYFGDERCLPEKHPARNSVMAAANWLDRVTIPRENIHVIPVGPGAVAAARAYSAIIDAAQRWKRGDDLPIAHIHGRCGIDVYLDPAAESGVPGL